MGFRKTMSLLLLVVLIIGVALPLTAQAETTLLNVSYDPTRELSQELPPLPSPGKLL